MKLRPMTWVDADFMWKLKNYPETRKFAIASHDEIKREDHYKWLEKNIQYFQIIEVHEGVCGAVRVRDNEVSIWIDRKHWGKGIATYTLQTIAKRGMMCKIVDGNIGSMRAFVRAGFTPIKYIDNYYIFQV